MKPILRLIPILLLLSSCRNPNGGGLNVILISLDNLRSDHVTSYGYERDITPTLDSLASEGIRFSIFQAQAPRTLPSHASVFTGLSVASHCTGKFEDCAFDPDLPSIQSTLKTRGYTTAGFGNVIYFTDSYRFDAHLDYLQCNIKGYYTGAQTFSDARSWIEEQREDGRSFFVFIHILEIHMPFDPPEPFDRMFTENGSEGIIQWEVDSQGNLLNPQDCTHLLNLYDGEIAYTDSILGEFLSYLRTSGLADSSLVIVFSDHGEEFLEHGGWFHGHSLYQELLGVPLIISGPGIEKDLVDSLPSAHFDIFPTILDYLDIPIPEDVEGVSLLSDSLRSGRAIPSSGLDPQWSGFGGTNPNACYLVSVLKSGMKIIMDMRTGHAEMFDLGNDPGEYHPLPADSSLILDAEDYWTSIPLGDPPPVDTSLVNDTLRDLGYM